MYGGEQLGFKRLLACKAVLAAKLFCVRGEAVEMDGKRLTLSKGLGRIRGMVNQIVKNNTFVVRHGGDGRAASRQGAF